MQIHEILEFTVLPSAAILVGGLLAGVRPLSPRLGSILQHFAAGVVFAAVAAELLPELKGSGRPLAVAVGFLAGVAAVLAVKLGSDRLEARNAGLLPVGFLAAMGVDVLLDGALLGLGFVAGAREGILLTIALTLEVLFLGLSTGAMLSARGLSTARTLGLLALLALAIPAGALAGASFLSHAGGALFTAVLAFGAAALLYLVTEELLVEAHEQDATPVLGAWFFVGFLLIVLIEMTAS